MLTPIVNAHADKAYLFREDQIHPIVAEKQYKFGDKKINTSDVIPDDALCFMLYHRIFETNVKNITLKDCSVADLYKSKMLVSKVFRKAYPKKEFINHFSRADSKQNKIMQKKLQTASIAIQKDSHKLLEQTQYWAPSVSAWKPLKKIPNSSLRMACIVEDRLYQGLRFEGEVMLLTPDNWQQVITYSKPDFLFMESISTTATGYWQMGQCMASSKGDELLEIIALAQKLSIPAVFWITKGHEYHEHYKKFARYFDYVFCADPREAEILQTEGVNGEVLLPCVQPALYNPFRIHEHYNSFNLGVLFDGWVDLDRIGDQLEVLNKVKPYGLSIIESRYQVFKNRLDLLPEYIESFLGCVSRQSRILALKYAMAYITFDQTLSTQTTQQWMTLEALASRLPVVYHGSLSEDDMRKGLVIDCPQEMEFLVEFVRFQEDELYRQRVAHLGWRNACLHHTFAHRVQKICKKIGIQHDWEEFPKASMITPTFRRDMLPRCLETFERQTYSNKELIVVFNGNTLPPLKELGEVEQRNDIKMINVPGDIFAGACLNYGHLHAQGEYYFRIDDDDHYGPNYILDMILHARSIDADLFGKPPAPIVFEGDNTVYARTAISPLNIVPQELLSDGRVWLGGNSIAGSKYFFKENHYQDGMYGAADSALMYSLNPDDTNVFAIMDDLNLVAERKIDQTSHTWKIDPEEIKSNSLSPQMLEDLMV